MSPRGRSSDDLARSKQERENHRRRWTSPSRRNMRRLSSSEVLPYKLPSSNLERFDEELRAMRQQTKGLATAGRKRMASDDPNGSDHTESNPNLIVNGGEGELRGTNGKVGWVGHSTPVFGNLRKKRLSRESSRGKSRIDSNRPKRRSLSRNRGGFSSTSSIIEVKNKMKERGLYPSKSRSVSGRSQRASIPLGQSTSETTQNKLVGRCVINAITMLLALTIGYHISSRSHLAPVVPLRRVSILHIL